MAKRYRNVFILLLVAALLVSPFIALPVWAESAIFFVLLGTVVIAIIRDDPDKPDSWTSWGDLP